MQAVSSRIRTRVAESMSYDDNNYTTGTSFRQVLVRNAAAQVELEVAFYF